MYIGVVLPAQLFTLALVADFGRIVMASHMTGNVADSVAMAGATAYLPDGTFDRGTGGMAATATYQEAVAQGMMPGDVTAAMSYTYLDKTVTARIAWTLDDSLVLWFFAPGTKIGGTSVRTTIVCDPNANTVGTTVRQVCPYPV